MSSILDPDAVNINAALDQSEAEVVHALGAPLNFAQRERALSDARRWVSDVRQRRDERPPLDAFLQEFGLSNPEGIALMCLAEALLRIPDDATADRFIAEKLGSGDWDAHAGRSSSLFVNASTWGLMLTGRLVELPEEARRQPGRWAGQLTRRLGEPVVRAALRRSMQIMGGEFVVGRTIDEALTRAERDPGLALCSFDMLGEGARTDAQARHYLAEYAAAIEAIAAATRTARARGAAPEAVHSISIKLSALEPRYSLPQRERVVRRLVPRAVELARLAARHGLGLTIDAEESDRLEISLAVIAALARDSQTCAWPGLGLAIQAYGRRAIATIDYVVGLARAQARRMTVRLVKGAYWDTEIKRAQERGLAGYPVFTRKANTDVSYLAGAQRLLAAAPTIYPQFATHNAYTMAAVLALRAPGVACEFQRLHGMGALLYDSARRSTEDFPALRTYAPVGPHRDLLAYLVRRLLENGANTSFVNRLMDETVPVEEFVTDPLVTLGAAASIEHPTLPSPPALYGTARRNSRGVDLGRSENIDHWQRMVALREPPLEAPMRETVNPCHGDWVKITNPADRRECVGEVRFADASDVSVAMDRAAVAFAGWNAEPAAVRAACLERTADGIEQARDDLQRLLVKEAGKTLQDAIAEVREAADFCRYYAVEARRLFAGPVELPGPTGESNKLFLEGRGVIAAISPWNFPLAIFVGQVAAALAAGNTVVAKPAESTPLIARRAVALLHAAGIPEAALQLLPMLGPPFGSAALVHAALAGVIFTGSTHTARWLNRQLAARDGAILPLIAETGGQNAMIVDSTALLEQVIDDVVASAFGSAGQRCSALRVLCLQEDIADAAIEMLHGAMDELVVGDPADIATDVGPIMSAAAAKQLTEHVAAMQSMGRVLQALPLDGKHQHGSFVAPHMLELKSLRELEREHFGPLLHVLRFKANELPKLLAEIRATGYALTLGVHSRLESAWQQIFAETAVGNVYVNRNMIGAVVGVQPFGGSGLSGTGPKAGGPHYLARLAIERTLTVNTTATGGNAALLQLSA
jgi:RHH-type proline utilization regulon transcriptional repressor/proline dehydrogenase/delta 1-pyrroline-5-carboxylate dehydrogenase